MDWVLLWTAVAAVAAVATVAVALVAWLRPRAPRRGTPAAHERLTVGVHYAMPFFNEADGTVEFGGDLVGVTAHNGTERPVRATGWGVTLPGRRHIVAMTPTTRWEPSLPHWTQPGDEATWYLTVAEARRLAAEQRCAFADMVAYVSFADGRQISAASGLSLK